MLEHTPQGFPQVSAAYLAATPFLDHDHPLVREFALAHTDGAATPREKAVRLFYAVRDGFRYDPFTVDPSPEGFRASRVLENGYGWCLPKGNLLAAAARAVGIPAAIGTSDVVNHLTSEKLKAKMGGVEIFAHHGYAVLHLDGQWLKAAPAFNLSMCERFGVLPTEFDGTGHAILQEFDAAQRKHMEYLRDHGVWSDFPYQRVIDDFRKIYPRAMWDASAVAAADTPDGAFKA
jgi:transglutaminase-like putative cysteine protease